MSWPLTLTFAESLTQVDSLALVNRPVQGLLLDRLIQQDAVNVFRNLAIGETLAHFDGLRFALGNNVGVGPEVLFLSDRIILQDNLVNSNLALTQMPREVVVLPSSGNVRITQLPREAVIKPTSPNLRLTQLPRELVMQTAEAYIVINDYQMLITEQLILQDTFTAFYPGLFFFNFGERNSPGIADQDTNQNVKVKGNQNIKADKQQSADTSLNHWTERLQMNFVPSSSFQSFTDQLTQSDAIATKLPVTLNTTVADQTQGMSDTIGEILGIQQPLIQTINLWQEFFAQPFLGIFAESNADQWQDSLAGFMPYFMPLSDAMVMSDSLTLPIGQLYSDALTMTDSSSEELDYLAMLVDALVLSDSLAFNNPQSYQDQLTMSDSFTIAEALDELLSDDGSGNWADAIAEVLATSSFQDQLVLVDSFTLGYGNYLPDQLIMSDSEKLLFGIGLNVFEQVILSDQFGQFPGLFIVEQLQLSDTIQFPVWLSLADQLAQADSIGAGYGSKVSDSSSMADAMNLVESFETLLADATPAMLENLQQMFNYLMAIQDGNQMMEQLYIMYGLIVSGEFLEFDDEINVVGIVLPFLVDDAGQTWLDAILTELVFAPGEIVVREFKTLAQILASQLDTVQEQQVDRFKTQGEQQAEFDVLLLGDGQ